MLYFSKFCQKKIPTPFIILATDMKKRSTSTQWAMLYFSFNYAQPAS